MPNFAYMDPPQLRQGLGFVGREYDAKKNSEASPSHHSRLAQ